ncbi:MAG: hypothetical protein IJ160_06605 [Muribaculaceae bacterium]|nr:hypothetical protein [Muribaculaceae bacterium]
MTKTVLNRLIVLLSVMLLGLTAKAQTAQYLIVTQQDESQVSFALAEKPVITLTDGIFKAETTTQTLEIALADVLNYKFSDQAPYTDIDQVKTDAKPVIEAGKAHLDALKPGTVVNVFTVDGRRAASASAGADGTVDIDLGGMGAGVYILATPTASYKIYNR